MITAKEQTKAYFAKLANGEQPDQQELISALTPDMLNRMLQIERDLGLKCGAEQKETEMICRLLASGMPEDEVALILCIKAAMVSDIAKAQKEQIATYAKQLKGRQRRKYAE